MADVVSKSDATVYALSVHTPDYPAGSWLINPAGLATLLAASVPNKYWKHNGGVTDILEMTQGEKDAVDAAVPNAERVFTADDATPDVSVGTQWCTANANATSVTTFDGGSDGQVIYVRITDAKTTFVHGATLDLILGHDLNAQQGEIWVFVLQDTVWRLRALPFRAIHTYQFAGQTGAGDETEKALLFGGLPGTAVVAKNDNDARAPKMFNYGILLWASLLNWVTGGDTLDQWKVVKLADVIHDSGSGQAIGNGTNQMIHWANASGLPGAGVISNNPADAGGNWEIWVTKSGTSATMECAAAIQIMDNELR